MFQTSNEPTHVADVKVGKVRGNSRWYPQLRLPSRYGGIAGQKASIYAASGGGKYVTFVIRVGGDKKQAARDGVSKHEDIGETRESEMPIRPCGGHDAGSNLALGLWFSYFKL